WPESMMFWTISCGLALRSTTTIWPRGIMMSRTWMVATSRTPSSMLNSSASRMRLRRAWSSISISAWRSRGAARKAPAQRASRPDRRPRVLGGLSSVIVRFTLPVGVGPAELGEPVRLQRLHGRRLLVGLVVAARQVQRTVNHHAGPMRVQRLGLLGGLGLHHLPTNHQVTEQRQAELGRQLGREGEHVGR